MLSELPSKMSPSGASEGHARGLTARPSASLRTHHSHFTHNLKTLYSLLQPKRTQNALRLQLTKKGKNRRSSCESSAGAEDGVRLAPGHPHRLLTESPRTPKLAVPSRTTAVKKAEDADW